LFFFAIFFPVCVGQTDRKLMPVRGVREDMAMGFMRYALADKGFANKNEWHGDKVGDE